MDFFNDPYNLKAPHVELVAVYDIKKHKIVHITGKSHPVAFQKQNLITASIESHFMREGNRRVLILGCHDLNMFSRRAYSNNIPHGRVRRYMNRLQQLSKKYRIKTIIQHPHSTESARTWLIGWAGVKKLLRPEHYVGTGKYYAHGSKQRSDLDRVLSSTKYGNVMDIVVSRDKQKNKFHVNFRA